MGVLGRRNKHCNYGLLWAEEALGASDLRKMLQA